MAAKTSTLRKSRPQPTATVTPSGTDPSRLRANNERNSWFIVLREEVRVAGERAVVGGLGRDGSGEGFGGGG